MSDQIELPLFPLAILPLPKERISLHIFEPRYRQLLKDIESEDQSFGIYYSHGLNKDRLGGLVKLESIVKKYSSGESDIVVKCSDTFLLSKFYNKIPFKPYPGGMIVPLSSFEQTTISREFKAEVLEFMSLIKMTKVELDFNIHDVANLLNLDIGDRLKYLKLLNIEKREAFLKERLRYRKFIVEQEIKVKDNFFLN